MSYIFPKRELKGTDVLDPEGLDADILPVVELVGGSLNEHNFNERISGQVDADRGAYQRPFVAVRRVNPGLPKSTAAHTHARPSSERTTPTVSAPWWIPGDLQWHTIDDGATHEMSVSLTTGTGKVWVNGWAQYFFLPDHENIGRPPDSYTWHLDGGRKITDVTLDGWRAERLGDRSHNSSYAANVKFAIRVDGRIVGDTITGRVDTRPRQSPPTPEFSIPSERHGHRHPAETHSINPAAGVVRVGCIVDVGPGDHTIELVACRTRHRKRGNAPKTYRDSVKGRRLNPLVAIYNSQLAVIEVPEDPQGSSGVPSLGIQTFTAEDSISTASMDTDRVEKVRSKLNDLSPDSLGRGALNHNHLKGPVIWAGTADLPGDAKDRVIHAAFPGFEPVPPDGTTYTHTVPGPVLGGDPHPHTRLGSPHAGVGWDHVLELPLGHPAPGLDVTTERCFLVVMGNVQLKDIYKGNKTNFNNVLATFSLGYKLTEVGSSPIVHIPHTDIDSPYDTYFVPQETICHAVNSNMSVWNDDGIKNKVFEDYPLHIDVPLMWVVDISQRSSISVPGNYNTKPPVKSDGTALNIKSLHILASVTPKGGDKDYVIIGGVDTPAGTHDANITLNRANLSAFLLRY